MNPWGKNLPDDIIRTVKYQWYKARPVWKRAGYEPEDLKQLAWEALIRLPKDAGIGYQVRSISNRIVSERRKIEKIEEKTFTQEIDGIPEQSRTQEDLITQKLLESGEYGQTG